MAMDRHLTARMDTLPLQTLQSDVSLQLVLTEPAFGTIYRTAWTFCFHWARLCVFDQPAGDSMEDRGVGAGVADPVRLCRDQVDVWTADAGHGLGRDYGAAGTCGGWVGAGVWLPWDTEQSAECVCVCGVADDYFCERVLCDSVSHWADA